MKYEFLLQTWGGFYNEEHKKVHGYEDGYHYFDTEKERAAYIESIKRVEIELGARYFAHSTAEGYHVRDEVIAHRICKHEGKEYHTTCAFPPCYPYIAAKYHVENKWYPGFNDYPLGEDFDYENNKIEIIKEWVVGAFDLDEST